MVLTSHSTTLPREPRRRRLSLSRRRGRAGDVDGHAILAEANADREPGVAAALVDLERVDGPVGLAEGGRVVGDVGFAVAGQAAAVAGAPDVAGPVAAEGGVENLYFDVVSLLDRWE